MGWNKGTLKDPNVGEVCISITEADYNGTDQGGIGDYNVSGQCTLLYGYDTKAKH